MATVLAKFQETQRMPEEQYLGFREELRTSSSTLGTIVGVLKEILNTRRDNVALQGDPDTSMDDELPTTSAGRPVTGPPHQHPTPCRGRTTPQTVPEIQDKDRAQCQDPRQEMRPP
ncbi:hypothetical protein NDU88_004884 [Pleurodeles waltl]|uniref:Uncharacterized protein n=1 Tax=Pleurodeles waltl TaxID=8319 RepID=A0AAV7VL74_PLEWA|nr:hypothetical protein NDU88_004884 [Pleurodeles waltl]